MKTFAQLSEPFNERPERTQRDRVKLKAQTQLDKWNGNLGTSQILRAHKSDAS